MPPPPVPVIDAVVLAAGASRRMAPHHKLLLRAADGRRMIAVTVAALEATPLREIVVVVGDRAEAVAAALEGARVRMVHNPDHASGLSTSLRAGIAALEGSAQAVLVALADMPGIRPEQIAALLAAWRPGMIVAPAFDGRRGNPVLWDRRFLPALRGLAGDGGGAALLTRHAAALHLVPMADDAVLRDADTQAALRHLPHGPWQADDGTPHRP